ncbi:MAG TPA: outer membrane beta-barrel protein [Gemmatimonadaceae bacterium]|nr:outer membrane beta-barrel protein [Gemmatimonadaceae bacterium]
MNRTSTMRTAALALALVSSVVSNSRAQYRTRDAFSRVDTARHATSTTARASSVVAAASKQQSPGAAGNFYIGVAAGASMPSGGFSDFYRNGWNADIPIGWRAPNSPLGLRADIAYSRWDGETINGVKVGSAALWDAMLDATVDMPFGMNKTSSFYMFGGAGAHYFPSYGGASGSVATTPVDTSGNAPPPPPPGGGYPQVNQVNDAITPADRSSTTRLGVNGGAGLSFGLPQGSALFVEGRYVSVFTRAEHTNYWPIVAGVRWTVR